MCGITGIYSFNNNGVKYLSFIDAAVNALSKRGPDGRGIYKTDKIALGHSRLAIIDTSEASAQPFTDNSGRYTIIFNGEYYNHKEHRKHLEGKGIVFMSNGDTEVLLYMYINYGPSFIEKVNGCFAVAIYDNKVDSLFIVRDRMGIKPLIYYLDDDKLIFGSEMKSLLAFNIPKVIDKVSLNTYLQLNYIPNPYSIFENVRKLYAGHYLLIKNNKVEKIKYYEIPHHEKPDSNISYIEAQEKIVTLLDESVMRRLISDVPLGTFLSGGIDSSIITAIASKYTRNLNTFSIGYKDEPFFDETYYAELVAKKYNTNHHVFKLSNSDLFEHFYEVLDYIDEPFADSSALAVYILSKYTRQYVTVALSGDGADEMFAGYNKHRAHYNAINLHTLNAILKSSGSIFKYFPQSRNSKLSNKFRQIYRYSEGLTLTDKERYWQWCLFNDKKYANSIYKDTFAADEFKNRKDIILKNINNNSSINDLLYTDMNIVLSGDMLHKVDLMSMSNGLEVRTPFLDHNLVNYVFSLPDKFKIDKNIKKKILQDSFRKDLPVELYNRPKHGFEVPLLKWFQTELKSLINDDLLADDFIKEQNIFNLSSVKELKKKLNNNTKEDISSKIWGLIVFQYWWKKVMSYK